MQHELKIAQGIKYRKIIKAAIARWVKDFQEGRIEVQTVDDLRKLIELDIELQNDEFLARFETDRITALFVEYFK